jgi:hypothetical protein
MAATVLRYSCQKRTAQEIKIMMTRRMKVLQAGGGVATEIMASKPRRILKGFGMIDKRSCHQDGGFLTDSKLAPFSTRREDASPVVNPASVTCRWRSAASGVMEAYACRTVSEEAERKTGLSRQLFATRPLPESAGDGVLRPSSVSVAWLTPLDLDKIDLGNAQDLVEEPTMAEGNMEY